MFDVYEKDITENLGDNRNLILLGVRADADIKHRNQRIIELNIEMNQYKEAIYNYMSMGHAGELDEVVEIFMKEHLPEDPAL